MNYRREIDGLRALAVLPVIFFHAGFKAFSGGFVGVDVFFVISGYLITSILLGEIEQGTFSIVRFYERRARRILPALFLVLLACIPFAWFLLLPQDLVSFSKSLVSISAFISNVYFWSERGYFGTSTELKPLIHTWSLAVEEQYYVFFPLLLMLLAGRVRLRNHVLAVLFVVSCGLCVWLTSVHQDSAFYLLPTRLWELLVGSSVAISLYGAGRKAASAGGSYLASALGSLGVALVLYSIFFFDETTPFPGYAALFPVMGSALIVAFGTEDTIVGRFLGWRVWVAIGLVSYSAYLWHQPLLAFLRHSGREMTDPLRVAVVAVTFVLSWFSWKYVEQPWRKQRYSRKAVFVSALAGLVLFAAVGAIGVANRGFLQRYDEADVLVVESSIDAGTYVAARFDRLVHAQFEPGVAKKKIVVIGDSFGKDLVNAVYEGGLSGKLQLSTHQINGECGNLYLEEDFTRHIDAAKLPRCRLLGWYGNDRLVALMRQADAIWLASSWTEWVARELPRSVENLQRDFGKPVLVFGAKDFGRVDTRTMLKIPADRRSTYTNKVEPGFVKVQNLMRAGLSDQQFVDVEAALCGTDALVCRIFDDRGEPVTFDGGHLTKSGARKLGEAMAGRGLVDDLQRQGTCDRGPEPCALSDAATPAPRR